MNRSAARSLQEGLEETLTLHRLEVFEEVGRSLKTTNSIENLNSLVEDYIDNVKRWHHSEQRARWFALGLLEAEQRMNRIAGHEDLPKLRDALQRELDLSEKNREEETVKEPLSEEENQLRTGNPLDKSPLLSLVHPLIAFQSCELKSQDFVPFGKTTDGGPQTAGSRRSSAVCRPPTAVVARKGSTSAVNSHCLVCDPSFDLFKFEMLSRSDGRSVCLER